MPLEDLTRIDIITTSDEGNPVLVITDAGVTPEPDERYALIMQKIGFYVSAISDETFRQDIGEKFAKSSRKGSPTLFPNDFEIRVVCANPPTDAMLAITAVTPKGEHDYPIRVEFEHAPINGSLTSSRVRRKAPQEPEMSEELSKLIAMAVELGIDQLKDGISAVRSAWVKDGGVSVAIYAEFDDAREAVHAAKDHATSLSDADFFALSYDGRMATEEGGLGDALIVEACERGQEKGVVYGQLYQPKKFLRKFKVVGEKKFLDTTENVLG